MRREGKPGPFIPFEVLAQIGPARATTPAPARRRRRATRAVGARAKRPRSGDNVYARAETLAPARGRMRAGDNACVRATTFAPVRRRVPSGRGVFSPTPQTSTLERRRLHPATTLASGRRRTCAPRRQRLRPCDDGCRAEGVFFHQHPKLQRSGDDVCVRATTLAHRRRRPRSRDDVWILFGIFFFFCNPNKTFPLSLFENYSNCVEDGNPKLFLLVGVFLSALNRDLAFLSRHLSI